VIALAIDSAVILGTGASNQPTGVRYQSGVVDKSGTNGTDMAWSDVVGLVEAIATANAATGRLAFVTNPHMRGVLSQTLKLASGTSADFIWESGPTPLAGFPAVVTSAIPANLTKGTGTNLSYVFFGNWGDVILGRWSGVDILVDPYTGGSAGTVRIIAFADVDVAIRHPESFVYGYYY